MSPSWCIGGKNMFRLANIIKRLSLLEKQSAWWLLVHICAASLALGSCSGQRPKTQWQWWAAFPAVTWHWASRCNPQACDIGCSHGAMFEYFAFPLSFISAQGLLVSVYVSEQVAWCISKASITMVIQAMWNMLCSRYSFPSKYLFPSGLLRNDSQSVSETQPWNPASSFGIKIN